MYRENLQTLGLSEKESLVYLSLLRLGPSAASVLARTTGIKRTSVYDILNGLLEKHLISSFKQGKYTYYVVDDVNELYLQQKQKMKLAQKLTETFKHSDSMQYGLQVHHYKGVEGYREIYEEILRVRPKEIKVWINLDNFYKGLNAQREVEWTDERIQKRIYARLIMQDTKMGRSFKKDDAKSHRETRLIKKFPFETTCFLYEDQVLLFDATEEVQAIRIQNPLLSDMFSQIFQMNWESLDI